MHKLGVVDEFLSVARDSIGETRSQVRRSRRRRPVYQMAHIAETILAVTFESSCRLSHCQSFEIRDLDVVCKDVHMCVDLQSSLVVCSFGHIYCLLAKVVVALTCLLFPHPLDTDLSNNTERYSPGIDSNDQHSKREDRTEAT